jgi:hypothetical protein
MTPEEIMAKQVENMHLIGIATQRNAKSDNDVVDVTVKLKYFTYCCGEPHEYQDAVATIIHLLGGNK